MGTRDLTKTVCFLKERYDDNTTQYAFSFAHVQNDEAAEAIAEAIWGAEIVHMAKQELGRPHAWVHPAILQN
jgi:hypothetical protein